MNDMSTTSMEQTPWLDDHQQRVWRLWLDVTTRLPQVLNRQLSRETDLSLQDFEVLVMVSEAPDRRMRVVALADLMGWERSRLSHHLTRMEGRGLVMRSTCAEDRRGAVVTLTDRGMDELVDAAPGHAALVRRVVFGGLDCDHLDELETILGHIAASLDAED
ncbi:MarR family winged helix-turn-helix transcriptional regulator [Acidipropionibacterium timonense]|uniref:MarR family winged helix-turn-helix transcriptional regulator n=1 Tax=Acidipropionibacterium timonense TaxID=2161818 RepID=UPI001030A563|nr:MarR family transcriptional regulator [Acidipropionibacterium timonense]